MKLFMLCLICVALGTYAYTAFMLECDPRFNTSHPGTTQVHLEGLEEEWRLLSEKELRELGRRFHVGERRSIPPSRVQAFIESDKAFRETHGAEAVSWTHAHGGNVDVTRFMMTMTLAEWREKHRLDQHNQVVLDVNPPNIESVYLTVGAQQVVGSDYTKDSVSHNLDMLEMGQHNFTIALCTQSLEHVMRPHRSVRNLRRHLVPGGLLVVSQPWVNRPHMSPVHFFQYTGFGMLMLLESNGFEVLDYFDWGSDLYAVHNLVHRRWPNVRSYGKISNETYDSERNRYAQTMLLARVRA